MRFLRCHRISHELKSLVISVCAHIAPSVQSPAFFSFRLVALPLFKGKTWNERTVIAGTWSSFWPSVNQFVSIAALLDNHGKLQWINFPYGLITQLLWLLPHVSGVFSYRNKQLYWKLLFMTCNEEFSSWALLVAWWLRDGCVMVAWSVTSSLLPLFHVIEKSLWSDLVHVCGRLILFFWGGGRGGRGRGRGGSSF